MICSKEFELLCYKQRLDIYLAMQYNRDIKYLESLIEELNNELSSQKFNTRTETK